MAEEYFDEDTLFKVQNTLLNIAGFNETETESIINALQNAGILFRERVKPLKVAFYHSKVVEIEAIQFVGGAENATPIIKWVLENGGTARWQEGRLSKITFMSEAMPIPEGIAVLTVDGNIALVAEGSWLIRGTAGEFYPCRDDVFKTKYELI